MKPGGRREEERGKKKVNYVSFSVEEEQDWKFDDFERQKKGIERLSKNEVQCGVEGERKPYLLYSSLTL